MPEAAAELAAGWWRRRRRRRVPCTSDTAAATLLLAVAGMHTVMGKAVVPGRVFTAEVQAVHHHCQRESFAAVRGAAADAAQAAAQGRHQVMIFQHVEWEVRGEGGRIVADVAAYMLNRLHWAERYRHRFHVQHADAAGATTAVPGLPAKALLKVLQHTVGLGESGNVEWVAFMGLGTWVDPLNPIDLRQMLALQALQGRLAAVVSDPAKDTGVVLVRSSAEAVALVAQWVAAGSYPPVDVGLPAELYLVGRPAAASLASLSTAVIFGARYGACLAGSQPPPQVTPTADASAVDPPNGIRVLPGRSSRPAAADDTDEEARVDFGQFGVPEGDWFEDLIPPTLRGRYGKLAKIGYGQYALRRSRPVVGATERMNLFWQKVLNRQCVKMVVLGASVSVGVNVGGIEEAWHALFARLLNVKHPCDGGNHTSILSGVVGGCHSGSFLDHVDMFDAEDEIDLVMVEFGANDPFEAGRGQGVRELDDPGNRLGTGLEDLEWATELIVRRVLELRKPEPVALIYVEVSWYFHQWLKLIDGEGPARGELYKTEYAGVGSWGHYSMLQYYGVPQMSTIEFTQLSWEHPNRTDLAVEFKDRPGVFVTDGCCHPRDWVHAFASMVLTYNFETEYARSQTLSERGPRYAEDRSMHSPPILKTPWRMTQAEVEKYTHAAVTSMNFMKRAPTAAEIGVAEGWEFIADSKGKTGMIATKAGSHVSFKLEPAVYETLLVGYLTSYEKITPVRVWVDHDAAADQTACRNPKLGKTIDPWHDGWIGKVSVYRSFPTRAPKGGGYVHFCLSEDNKGRFDDKTEGKFKILSLTYM